MSPGKDQLSDEKEMLENITITDTKHEGYPHTIRHLGTFEFKGPQGSHCCIVTEPLGYSLDYVRKLRDGGDLGVAPNIVKRVTKHILLGLAYLHDVCGLVHGGAER